MVKFCNRLSIITKTTHAYVMEVIRAISGYSHHLYYPNIYVKLIVFSDDFERAKQTLEAQYRQFIAVQPSSGVLDLVFDEHKIMENLR